MIATSRWLFVLFGCYLLLPQVAEGKNKPTLDAWMDGELIPSVVTQLASHPRFADEVVRFVIMQDGKPSAMTNSLALALRDRLQDAVIDQSGMRVGWQVDRQKFDRRYEQSRVDCTTSEVHYYIGLELEELRSGRFSVSVRALDVDDQRAAEQAILTALDQPEDPSAALVAIEPASMLRGGVFHI